MKKSILMMLGAALFLNINTACASIDAAKAEAFVKQVTENGVEDIINAKISVQEKDGSITNLGEKYGNKQRSEKGTAGKDS